MRIHERAKVRERAKCHQGSPRVSYTGYWMMDDVCVGQACARMPIGRRCTVELYCHPAQKTGRNYYGLTIVAGGEVRDCYDDITLSFRISHVLVLNV